jgi:hypothetical protein
MIKVLSWLLIILLIVSGAIYYGLKFSANYLEDGSYLTTPAFKAKHVWRMEATGLDARVYEFSPKSDPSKNCVVWTGTNKAAMQCF